MISIIAWIGNQKITLHEVYVSGKYLRDISSKPFVNYRYKHGRHFAFIVFDNFEEYTIIQRLVYGHVGKREWTNTSLVLVPSVAFENMRKNIMVAAYAVDHSLIEDWDIIMDLQGLFKGTVFDHCVNDLEDYVKEGEYEEYYPIMLIDVRKLERIVDVVQNI